MQYIHPFLGGSEILNRTAIDRWIIDIDDDDVLIAESANPNVVAYIRTHILPVREERARKEESGNLLTLEVNSNAKVNRHHEQFLTHWWKLGYRRADMLSKIRMSDRYIATLRQEVRGRTPIFTFVDASIHPGDTMTVFALDDEYSLGILSSALHLDWFRERCSTFKGDPRYTSTTVWDSFPWPQRPNAEDTRAVADGMLEILNIRERYLDRGIDLAQQYSVFRQLGSSQLKNLHGTLDEAVFRTYGFSRDEDNLAQLLALNHDLSSSPESTRGPGYHGLGDLRLSDMKVAPSIS